MRWVTSIITIQLYVELSNGTRDSIKSESNIKAWVACYFINCEVGSIIDSSIVKGARQQCANHHLITFCIVPGGFGCGCAAAGTAGRSRAAAGRT